MDNSASASQLLGLQVNTVRPDFQAEFFLLWESVFSLNIFNCVAQAYPVRGGESVFLRVNCW